MDLALAKERKAFARFKLRIRTYGTDAPPKAPIFLEIKRKVGNVIIKSRAKLNRATYHEKTVTHPDTAALLKSPKDNAVQLEFCRIANEIGARPKMLIRYIRESYFGANDDYARITFDRRISYRPHPRMAPARARGGRMEILAPDGRAGILPPRLSPPTFSN